MDEWRSKPLSELFIARNGDRYYGRPSDYGDRVKRLEIAGSLRWNIFPEVKRHIDDFVAKKFKQGQLIAASRDMTYNPFRMSLSSP
jgi:hypothetical protein